MKIEISGKELKSVLSRVGVAVSPRPSMPILGHVCIEPMADGLVMHATNLDISVSIQAEAKMQGDGSLLLPLDRLQRCAGGDLVTIEQQAKAAKVSTGNFWHVLPRLVDEKMPVNRLPKGEGVLRVAASDLISALESVLVSCAGNDLQPALPGVHFKAGGGELLYVATDGKRAAFRRFAVDGELPCFTLPRASVDALMRAAPFGEVEITADSTAVRFDWEDGELSSRLIESTYPNVLQIRQSILHYSPDWAVVDVAAMKVAVDRVSTINAGNRISLEVAGGKLRVAGATGDSSEIAEDMCDATGPDIPVAFCNGVFVSQALASCPFDTARISMGTFVGVANPDGDDWICAIAPLRNK